MIPNRIFLHKINMSLNAVTTSRFKTGMLAISLALPSTKKRTAENLLLQGMLRRGTQSYPSLSRLNLVLDDLYASTVEIKNNSYGKNRTLMLCAEFLDEAFVPAGTNLAEGVSHVLSELLLCPLTDAETGYFCAEALEKEKIHVCDALRATVNNPRAYAAERCVELMNRDNDDFPTTCELLRLVEEITPEELWLSYRELLAGAHRQAFYVGSLSPERVAKLLERTFSALPANTPLPLNPIRPSLAGEVVRKTETMAVSQGKLVIGLRSGVSIKDDEYFAAVVTNELLGASPASKLFLQVREALGLCYYCSSSYSSFTGNLLISSGIDVSQKERVEQEILRQLDAIRQGDFTPEELDNAKKSLRNAYRQIYDNPFDLHAFYAGRSFFGVEQTPESSLERLMKVREEEVVAFANKICTDTVFFLEGTACGEEVCDNEA